MPSSISTYSQNYAANLRFNEINAKLTEVQGQVASNQRTKSYAAAGDTDAQEIAFLLSQIQSAAGEVGKTNMQLSELGVANANLLGLVDLFTKIEADAVTFFDDTSRLQGESTASILFGLLGAIENVLNSQDANGNYIFGSTGGSGNVSLVSDINEGWKMIGPSYNANYYYHGGSTNNLLQIGYNTTSYGVRANDNEISSVIEEINKVIHGIRVDNLNGPGLQSKIQDLISTLRGSIDILSTKYSGQLELENEIGSYYKEATQYLEVIQLSYNEAQHFSSLEALERAKLAKDLAQLMKIVGMINQMVSKARNEYITSILA